MKTSSTRINYSRLHTPNHGKRASGYGAGNTNVIHTPYFQILKREVYAFVKEIPLGNTVSTNMVYSYIGGSPRLIDRILFHFNFEEGNPCGLTFKRTKRYRVLTRTEDVDVEF